MSFLHQLRDAIYKIGKFEVEFAEKDSEEWDEEHLLLGSDLEQLIGPADGRYISIILEDECQIKFYAVDIPIRVDLIAAFQGRVPSTSPNHRFGGVSINDPECHQETRELLASVGVILPEDWGVY